MARCEVCFRHCELSEGQTGFCGARICHDGKIVAKNYGRLSCIGFDPIEKKPLSRFHPGSMILSVSSCGCNLRCPFCQNSEISWSKEALFSVEHLDYVSPEQLVSCLPAYASRGNIGVAFTYNEPLVGYEYVRDTAKLVHGQGLKNAVVTNGTAELSVLAEIAPYIDAFNIDLKSFSADTYKNILGGDLRTVLDFITEAHRTAHVELTTLIVPGMNDTEQEMRELSSWIASLDKDTVLHISRFFPRFHLTDRPPTDVRIIYRLADIAREKLRYVVTGNC